MFRLFGFLVVVSCWLVRSAAVVLLLHMVGPSSSLSPRADAPTNEPNPPPNFRRIYPNEKKERSMREASAL